MVTTNLENFPDDAMLFLSDNCNLVTFMTEANFPRFLMKEAKVQMT